MMVNVTQNFSESFDENETGSILIKTVPPAMIVLETVGNIISIIVLTRPSIRNLPISSHLTVLAVSDLLILYTGLLPDLISDFFQMDIYLNEIGCKLQVWLFYSSLEFSSWMLVILTIERVISVWYPYKAHVVYTDRKTTGVTIGVTALVLLAINSHLLYGVSFEKAADADGNHVNLSCVIDKQFSEFYLETMPWIDSSVFFVSYLQS
jgi:hypothetical protein